MAIIYDTMNIFLKSPNYTVQNLGLKNTQRILAVIAYSNYSSDVDLTFKVYYKQKYTNVEKVLSFLLSKDKTYFKRKLTAGIQCREIRFEIIGTDVKTVSIIDAGIMIDILKIGVS